jgi:broad specificity polyphosphatase/5'/3'-nucleotidase SurE
VHYVNGSPVMACLYGLDVVAQRKWKAAPDLVVSGPNEGNNTGLVNTAAARSPICSTPSIAACRRWPSATPARAR